jgi:hypothetical protein
MPSVFDDVSCACLPADELPVLAELRSESGIEVALAEGRAWVRWPAGDEAALRRLLPVPGVRLYVAREGHWYAAGRRLPAFDVPQSLTYRPLCQVLTPAPLSTELVPLLDLKRVRIELRADHRPRGTTAVGSDLAVLARWVDATSALRLASIRAGLCEGQVLLLGERLPLLPGGQRYWGDVVLTPLGFRPEPDLPAEALREALGVGDEEILLLEQEKAEAIPRAAFRPLTRAGIRLAAGEGA